MMANSTISDGDFMAGKRRIAHSVETYRFSPTHTLSDYPLLIGEILRRDQLRIVKQAKRRGLLYGIGKALGMRVKWAVGAPGITDPGDVPSRHRESGARR